MKLVSYFCVSEPKIGIETSLKYPYFFSSLWLLGHNTYTLVSQQIMIIAHGTSPQVLKYSLEYIQHTVTDCWSCIDWSNFLRCQLDINSSSATIHPQVWAVDLSPSFKSSIQPFFTNSIQVIIPVLSSITCDESKDVSLSVLSLSLTHVCLGMYMMVTLFSPYLFTDSNQSLFSACVSLTYLHDAAVTEFSNQLEEN